MWKYYPQKGGFILIVPSVFYSGHGVPIPAADSAAWHRRCALSDQDQQSDLGAFYNELCDVIADTALYLCFLAFGFIQPELLLLIVFLAILSEYAGVMAPLIGQSRRYDGPMGKSDRAFAFGLLAVIIVVFPFFSNEFQYRAYIANGLLGIIGILLAITIYNRIKNSLENSSENK